MHDGTAGCHGESIWSPQKPALMPPDDSAESTGGRLCGRYPRSRTGSERVPESRRALQGLFRPWALAALPARQDVAAKSSKQPHRPKSAGDGYTDIVIIV